MKINPNEELFNTLTSESRGYFEANYNHFNIFEITFHNFCRLKIILEERGERN